MLKRNFLTQQLKLPVFLNLTQQILLQIILQIHLIYHFGQELATLNQHELAGHDHVFSRHFQPHSLQSRHISQVLLDDLGNRHIVNIHLVLGYEVQQQVQRPLKIF